MRRRVPSGASTTVIRSASRSTRATSLTKPVVAERSTGIPPIARMKTPNGQRKSVCLPMKVPPRWSASFAIRPIGKSQFEVCGATIRTIFGTSGTSPSKRQPVIRIRKRASPAARAPWARCTFGPSSGTCGSAKRRQG